MGYVGVYLTSCEATKETNTNMTLEGAQQQLITREHMLICYTTYVFINDEENNDPRQLCVGKDCQGKQYPLVVQAPIF